MQVRRWSLCAALLACPARGAAQAPVYDVRSVGCVRFAESVRSDIQSAFGSVRRSETVGRDGILVLRARADSAGLSLESWYDTLAVFREGPEGRSVPDAEGILGGRYRGTLGPQGDYLATVAPFVPAALRDVFDFSRVLPHFFPPLSPRALTPGSEWTDGAGLTIWRLADSAASGGSVARYRWIRRGEWDEGVAAGDSTLVVHRREVEDGSVRWRSGVGPLGWTSAVVAGIEFSGGTGRTEVRQQVSARRLEGACPGP